jgi:hypothetical protein
MKKLTSEMKQPSEEAGTTERITFNNQKTALTGHAAKIVFNITLQVYLHLFILYSCTFNQSFRFFVVIHALLSLFSLFDCFFLSFSIIVFLSFFLSFCLSFFRFFVFSFFRFFVLSFFLSLLLSFFLSFFLSFLRSHSLLFFFI